MNDDAITKVKEAQKQGWAHFAPLEAVTTPSAALLVKFARVRPGQRVLDVGCGTGVAAITAARLGADVYGIDLTPQLLERARENSAIAETRVDWREGDAEQLPYEMPGSMWSSANSDTCLRRGRRSRFARCCVSSSRAGQSRLRRGRRRFASAGHSSWSRTTCLRRHPEFCRRRNGAIRISSANDSAIA